MATLFSATLDLAKVLGLLFEGSADSGSTALKIVDSDLRDRAGTFTDGTLWITTGTQVNSTRLVNTHGVGELTFDTLTATLTAGDQYAVARPVMKRDQLRRAINLALQSIDPYTKDYEDATFITVADQEDYTLPTGVADVVDVWIATQAAAPFKYQMHMAWDELQSGKLRFLMNEPQLAGYRIRLGYNTRHAILTADTGAIDAGIDPIRLQWEAALWAWRSFLQSKDDRNVTGLDQEWFAEAIRQAQMAPKHRVAKRAKTLIFGRIDSNESTPRRWVT